MKIRYEFVNGDISEIEVDNYFGEILSEFNRNQRSSDRMYRRYNYSLGSIDYEGEEKYGYVDDYSLLFNDIYSLCNHILTKVEYRRVRLYVDGYTINEIAVKENVSDEAVRQSIRHSAEKLRERI